MVAFASQAADWFATSRNNNPNPQKIMKNHVKPTFAFLKALVILLVTTTLISCNKDEDEPDEPTPQNVTYRIDLEKIVALNISDAEGDNLEVYGTINSKLKRGNITEENMILSLTDETFILVGTSDSPLSQSVSYSVAPANIESSNLEVTASLTDRDPDGNANEFMGTRTISVALDDIDGTVEYQMVLDDISNHVVRLTYSITRE